MNSVKSVPSQIMWAPWHFNLGPLIDMEQKKWISEWLEWRCYPSRKLHFMPASQGLKETCASWLALLILLIINYILTSFWCGGFKTYKIDICITWSPTYPSPIFNNYQLRTKPVSFCPYLLLYFPCDFEANVGYYIISSISISVSFSDTELGKI